MGSSMGSVQPDSPALPQALSPVAVHTTMTDRWRTVIVQDARDSRRDGHVGADEPLGRPGGDGPPRPLQYGLSPTLAAMSRDRIERRLKGVSTRVKRLRADLAIAEEQLRQLVDDADDARLRALVSETPGASKEHRSADRHAEAMRRHRDGLVEEIAQLEQQLDELLDAMGAA